MDIIIIRINDRIEPEDDVLKLLRLICSDNITKQEKLEGLKAQGIRVEEIEEGVERMCDLSDLIVEKGVQQGVQLGTEQTGRKFAIKLYKRGISIADIAEMADAPAEKIRQWLEEEKLL